MGDSTGVLFVCMGNICRSPVARRIFERLVDERGVAARFRIDSCGTGGWHAGEGADPRSVEIAARHGLELAHVARKLRPAVDFDEFDLLLAMDLENRRELLRHGAPPERVFVEWDPVPLASASIGQVHRAVVVDPTTGLERAVAVKVQYPGVGDSIAADLSNADLLGALLKQGFGGLDPAEMVGEIKARITDELDYRLEAQNQAVFAEHYRGHPFIHVPEVLTSHSTARVLTTELVSGHSWGELLTWSQDERDLAGETLFRFVFRSLYGMRLFNGDPHPGNYLFHGDGRVTFLDFGLVKRFSDDEMATFIAMVRSAAYDHDGPAFRRIIEQAGMLQPGCPASDDEIGEYFSQFYESVRTDAPVTWSGEYASRIVRHTFDRSSPISQYATVPKAFVFIQRINLGLYALLGELHASGNYRRIAEELWPFVDGPPSTELGRREATWLARHRSTAAAR
jgi:protein-tyrosine-phosphatase